MAKTHFETGNALTKKLWDEQNFREMRIDSYFDRFMGSKRDNICYTKDEFTKEKGDNITFGYNNKLSGPGVSGTDTLEGNEEKLNTASFSVSLDRYRNAVRDDGDLSRRRPGTFVISEEAQHFLKIWGSEKIDSLCFDALFSSPSSIFYLNSSGVAVRGTVEATVKAALDATNSKLTPAFISYIKTAGKTGLNRTINPIQPVKVDGKNYWVLVTHPDSLYDLKRNSEYRENLREAEARGSSHPIFKDSVAVFDGVVIHEHENCTIATDGGGAAVAWNKALFLGQGALSWAWGKHPEMVMKKFDYDEEHGWAWAMTAGVGKTKFSSSDFGSFNVYLSRTQIADA